MKIQLQKQLIQSKNRSHQKDKASSNLKINVGGSTLQLKIKVMQFNKSKEYAKNTPVKIPNPIYLVTKHNNPK